MIIDSHYYSINNASSTLFLISLFSLFVVIKQSWSFSTYEWYHRGLPVTFFTRDDFPILRFCCHPCPHTLTFKNKASLLGKVFINSHSNSAGRYNPIPTASILCTRPEGTLQRIKMQILGGWESFGALYCRYTLKIVFKF